MREDVVVLWSMAVRFDVGDSRALETDLEYRPTHRRWMPRGFLEHVSDRFSSLSFRRTHKRNTYGYVCAPIVACLHGYFVLSGVIAVQLPLSVFRLLQMFLPGAG